MATRLEGVCLSAPQSSGKQATSVMSASHKITDYFPVIKNGEAPVFHCYKDCLFRRRDETVGPMIACDGCGLWFHHQCVDEKTDDRPEKDSFPWFCLECKSCFKEYKNIRKELGELKALVKSLVSKTKGPHPNQSSTTDVLLQDTTNGPKGLAADLKKSNSELEKLREENKELKVLLQNTNSLLHTILNERPWESEVGGSRANDNTPPLVACVQPPAVSNNNKGNPKNKKNRPKQTASRKQIAKPKSSSNSNGINNNIIPSVPTNDDEEIEVVEVQKAPKVAIKKKALLLGDSHVRRLNPDKLTNIIAAGIGGLKSDEILKKHKQVISENIDEVCDVIIHIGTNDLSTKTPKAIVHHVENIIQSLKSKNANVNIAISSVFLQKKNTSLNVKAVETNEALKYYCNMHGIDFIDNSSVGFRHLLEDGLHLNESGNKLFARNLLAHVKST